MNAMYFPPALHDELVGKLRKAKARRVGPSVEEAEHFIKCGDCGGWIDCRDLGQVFEHEGPLPHPSQDQEQ
jgi:hypothetical protein